jgi:RNA polymerase sigma-70 factor (ECF subfamily)
MLAVSFEEIAKLVGRSTEAAKQLASRARRRVKGAAPSRKLMSEQRELFSAFLTALRGRNFEGLAVLDPDLVVHVDEAGARPGAFSLR